MKRMSDSNNLRQERIGALMMNLKPIRNIALIFALFGSATALAQNNGVGGGNLCRQEIEKHRAQIEGWIERDEARDLDFTKALVEGWTYDDPAPAKSYKRAMLEVLNPGKVIVNCYTDLKQLNELIKSLVSVEERGSVEITGGCYNYKDSTGISRIACDASTEIDFQLVHHEYATIAGVEKRLGLSASDFSVSGQIGDFLHDQVRQVLGPKRVSLYAEGFSPKKLLERINQIFDQETIDLPHLEQKGIVGYAVCSDGKVRFFLNMSIAGVYLNWGFKEPLNAISVAYKGGVNGPWNGQYSNYLNTPSFEDSDGLILKMRQQKIISSEKNGKGWATEIDPKSVSYFEPNQFEVRLLTNGSLVFKLRNHLNWTASCISQGGLE